MKDLWNVSRLHPWNFLEHYQVDHILDRVIAPDWKAGILDQLSGLNNSLLLPLADKTLGMSN